MAVLPRVLITVVVLFCSVPAFAMPQFLQLYRADPFRNPNVDGCITCHMSAQGGDARNPFGQAFESGGEQITTLLRAQFPDRFIYPISKVSDTLTIHFSDPEKKQIVVESAGMKNLVDVDKRTVNGTAATNTTSPVKVAIPSGESQQETRSNVPVDPYAREGAFFGSTVVNLPNGKPQKKGGVDFFIAHRFGQDIDAAGFGGLFGFDSSATIAYGVRAGLTDRISLGILRSNLNKTISLSSTLQAARQGNKSPLTIQFKVGLDGKRNFNLYRRSHNPDVPRQYSEFIQIVGVRTINDRVSFLLAPTFAFNTRDERAASFASVVYGSTHNNTVSLGIGTGIRVLPTVSLVGEFIPRLAGYRGEEKDYGGLSVGLQKSTFRHTFELVVSRQQVMTPAAVAYQGVDTFRVGFNIYRKLR